MIFKLIPCDCYYCSNVRYPFVKHEDVSLCAEKRREGIYWKRPESNRLKYNKTKKEWEWKSSDIILT